MLDRKADVLRALVEEHVRTGEPVSSRMVLERSGLGVSSATVRNDLAVLEREGMVTKPHTSAGRVPTDRGYRYYVDHLRPGSLQLATRTRIESFFVTMHAELNRILKETSDFLSDITHYPSVVLGPGLEGHTVKDAHLVHLDSDVVLLVLVTEMGRVSQSVLRLTQPVDDVDVATAAEVLVERLTGSVIEAVPAPAVRVDLPAPAVDIVDRALAAVAESANAHREMFFGGTSLMTTLWGDLTKLHRILALLEQQAAMVDMLEGTTDGTLVRLGTEIAGGEDDLAVVSTGYEGEGLYGRIGVFGPLRMDYRRTIKVVEEVSEALGESLGS